MLLEQDRFGHSGYHKGTDSLSRGERMALRPAAAHVRLRTPGCGRPAADVGLGIGDPDARQCQHVLDRPNWQIARDAGRSVTGPRLCRFEFRRSLSSVPISDVPRILFHGLSKAIQRGCCLSRLVDRTSRVNHKELGANRFGRRFPSRTGVVAVDLDPENFRAKAPGFRWLVRENSPREFRTGCPRCLHKGNQAHQGRRATGVKPPSRRTELRMWQS